MKKFGLLNFQGSKGSYGFVIIDEEDINQAIDIIDKEKNENDEYSVSSCVERMENFGIKSHEYEEIYVDFGM